MLSEPQSATSPRRAFPERLAARASDLRAKFLARDYPVSLLIALITVAALIPSIMLAAVALDRWSRLEEARERERVISLAQASAQSIDRHLKSLINTAEVLAGSRHLQSRDIDVFESIARDAAVNADGDFILIDPSLQQLVNTRVPIGTKLPKTGNAQDVAGVLATGAPVVTDLARGAVAGNLLFAILVAVRINQSVDYVLAYVPKPSTILEVLMEPYRPDGWLAAVIDGRGQIVARTEAHDAFYGQQSSIRDRFNGDSGIVESTDLQGRAALTAYHRLTTTNWSSIAWVLKSQLAEPRERRFKLFLGMISAAILLSFLASWVVSRLVRTPAIKLVDLATRVGQDATMQHSPTLMREANVIGESLARASGDIRERTAALTAIGQRLQLAIDAAGAGFWTVDLSSGQHHLDARAKELAGFTSSEPIEVAALVNRIHEDDRGRVTEALRQARAPSGEGRFDVEFRFIGADGSERWVSTQAQQLKAADGTSQLVGIVRDITRRKRDDQKIQLLMREVVHRSKNLLAVVQSIAGQTARVGDSTTFLPRFRDRLGALAASQTLLVESEWKGVGVAELVKAQLAHFADLFGRRLTLEGAELRLKPDVAQAIGMALHELSTNAAKYGALSNSTGIVRVEWSIRAGAPRRRFHIRWAESGGPSSDAPAKPGFGSVVTGKMVEAATNGTVAVARDDGRFVWELEADADDVVDFSG